MPDFRTHSALTDRTVGLFRSVVAVIFLALVSHASLASAAPVNGTTQIKDVEIGIGEKFKIGFWVPIRFTVESSEQVQARYEITAPDGAGAPVTYEIDSGKLFTIPAGVPVELNGFVRIGRLKSAITVRCLDSSGDELAATTIIRDEDSGALRSTSELVLVLGPNVDLNTALARMGRQATAVESIFLTDPSGLPSHWLGWEAVDLLIVNTSDPAAEGAIRPDQVKAIDDWVLQGGKIFFSVGAEAATVYGRDGLISRLTPGEFDQVVAQTESAGIESFATASRPLLAIRGESIPVCRLRKVRGEIDAFEGNSPRDLPLVIRASHGLGRVILVTVDLDGELISKWPARDRFVARAILGERDTGDGQQGIQRSGRVTSIGFGDLSGQLRSALDEFRGVRFITFTFVAFLMVLFILCIGPGDYFLLKKVLRRMELTWITFGIIAVAFVALTMYAVRMSKGNSVQVNQVELVDVDVTTSTVRGSIWANIYSPSARRVEVSMSHDSNDPNVDVHDSLFSWQGLPGAGLGGMDTGIAPALISSAYTGSLNRVDGTLTAGLSDVPILPASTQSFAGRWSGQWKSPVTHELRVDRRSDSLDGEFVNPVDVTLENAVVFFGTWAYRVDQPIPPGGRVSIQRDARETTLKGYLTRRQVIDGLDVTSPWSTSNASMRQIMEVMFFFEASGGRDYTKLTQRLHFSGDLSGHLQPDRAILMGQAAPLRSRLMLDGESAEDLYDQTWTFYRVVLPVTDPFQREEP